VENTGNNASLVEEKTQTVSELRQTDPQRVIDFLLARKSWWKQEAERLKQSAERRIRSLRRQLKKEKEMNTLWKIACASLGVVTLSVIATAFVASQIVGASNRVQMDAPPKVAVSGRMQNTPASVLSSVLICNGNLQGSGTVISRGDAHAAILSAAHNFKGTIGGKFWVYYPDGTFTQAELIAWDLTRDLALAKVAADTVLDTAYVPDVMPSDTLTSVGYTNGQGPIYKHMTYTGYHFNNTQKRMWNLQLTDGSFGFGDSGSGVFLGDALVGVGTHVGRQYGSTQAYAISFEEIKEFLKENQSKLVDCGDYSAIRPKPVSTDGPPLWKPNPNVPLYIESGLAQDVNALKQDVAKLKKQADEPKLTRPSEIDTPAPQESKLRRPSDIK
jgi:S1-C subfamily serine protease